MKVGLICAVERELEPFLPHIEKSTSSKKAMITFYEGIIHEVNVVAAYSGVCKTNAAIATQILIDTYNADMVINAGTAGGMSRKLNLFDTVIATESAYHDVDKSILTKFHPWMPTIYIKSDETLIKLSRKAIKPLRSEQQIYFGRMVTGEKFIEDDNRDEINARYKPLTVDMETASIAHVCYVNQIPFIAVRTVTDTADHSGTGHFEKNCTDASFMAKESVLGLIKEIRNHFVDSSKIV